MSTTELKLNGTTVLSENNSTINLVTTTATIGSNALVVDSSGNVGIGTSSPSNPSGTSLTIFDTSIPRINLKNSTTGDTSTAGGELRQSGNQFSITNRQNSDLIFGTNNTERMRIDSSGNVKIYNNLRVDRGSTADYPLHLVSSGKYCTIGALNSTYVHIDTDSSSGIYFYDSISVASLDNRSDEVLKTNINTISDAISKVLAIRGVSFEWEVDKYPELKLKSGTNFGVIAQECESLHPEFVKESLHPTDENTSFKSLNYLELIPFLIEATKEQQITIESQQSQIDALTARIEALESN